MPKKSNPVGWFEIPVTNFKRAKAFYESVFSVKLADHDMNSMKMAFWPMASNSYGTSGSLVKIKGCKPSGSGTVVYFMVGDIKKTLAKVKAKGGKVLLPKTSIGEWGFVAHFRDSEGNRVALHSMK